MAALRYKTCTYCGREHVRDKAGDFSPPKYCGQCSADRRAIAARVFKSRSITAEEVHKSGKYLIARFS